MEGDPTEHTQYLRVVWVSKAGFGINSERCARIIMMKDTSY